MVRRFTLWGQRLDALSLRERGLIFAAGVTLVYIAWQTLFMDALNNRARAAAEHLVEARQHLAALAQADAGSATDPLTVAAARNRALTQRLAALDTELHEAATGYVAPERMTDMLRQILADQHGLSLVSLGNLPVQSLAQTPGTPLDAADVGPFLHPVEIVIDGDYVSVVAYLRSLEALPWRIHWQELDMKSGELPSNRVHLVIGALSLSRYWISV